MTQQNTSSKSSPNLFLIGAQKGGSSSFASHLVQHPDIAFHSIKEPNYFRMEDVAGCHAALDSVPAPTGAVRYLLDASVDYARYPLVPHVAQNINEICGSKDIRILYILRHPVDRAISEYFWKRERYGEYRPIETAFSADSQYIKSSLYDLQIRQYLEYFDRDVFHFVTFEKYVVAPQNAFDATCAWLGLPSIPLTQEHVALGSTDKDMTRSPKFALLNRLAYSSPVIKDVVKSVLPTHLLAKVTGALSKPVERPSVSDDLRAQMFARFFVHSVQETERLTGLSLSYWAESCARADV